MKRSTTETQERPFEKIYNIPLGDITISPDNVRKSDATKDLDELAASIKKHGLIQPVVLIGERDNPPYKLISGQRRFLAHKKLGKNHIRAVFAGPLSETDAVVRSLIENMQRLELDYADTAKAVTSLYEKYEKNERKVQQETGLSLKKVRDLILIESRASPKMKRLIKIGRASGRERV